MDSKRILLIAVIVWFGLSAYWYTCKIKGRCGNGSSDQIEVIDSGAVSTPADFSVYFLPSTAMFVHVDETNSALKPFADYLTKNKDKKVLLTGYTANLGRTAGYQQMSLARANVVKQSLVRIGVEPGKIVVEAKGISGQAATMSEEDRAKSRRVEVHVQ